MNSTKWLLALAPLLILSTLWAQTPATQPASPAAQQDAGQATSNADKDTPAVADQEQAAEPESVAVDEIPEVPKEIQDAIENQDQVHATMERFVPTEKLSEDRAVAFPNDI